VLSIITGYKQEKVTEAWRKQHNEELQSFNFSPNIIRLIKSRRIRWVKHAIHMVEIKNA
jgi:hypothetical protein